MLWLIKFLRAMVLHVLLALVAALLFFLAGIHDVYPLATDMIQAMRAQAIQNRLDGATIGYSGFAIVASLLFVATLALLVWVYVSITNVRRNALRFQAILLLVIYLVGAAGKWQEVRFAFENLDFLFAVLAALGVAMTTLVVPLSVVYALWGVARSPERSNCIATLDPRLAPGFLDLFQQTSRSSAYAIAKAADGGGVCACTCRCILAHSVGNVQVTAGSTSNKLAGAWQSLANIDAPAGNFDRTFDNSAFRAEGKRDERKEQAHECGRQRPGVSSNDRNAAHESIPLRPKPRIGLESGRCFTQGAFVDPQVVRREAAEDDLLNRRKLPHRRMNRGHRNRGCELDRVAVDAGADARKGERAEFFLGGEQQGTSITGG